MAYTPVDGTDDSNLLYGTNDADLIQGLLGNDTLYGGSGGDDTIFAGPVNPVPGYTDNDTVFGDTFAGGNTNDTIYGGYGDDTLYGDSYEGWGGGNDFVYGQEGNDTLMGGDGTDFLDGGLHTDTLFGGSGNDTLVGSSGNDRLNGDSGYDVAAYDRSFTTYSATFTSDGAVQITDSDGTDRLTGIERINFSDGFYDVHTGDASNNALTADPNVWSFLYGGGGNDTLTGGSYNDVLAGSTGNDTLSGNSGYDVAVYFGDYTSYNASFTQNGAVQLTGIEGTDLLTGIEQINFAGAGVFKVYTGDAGNNTLNADPYTLALLYGGGGNDILTSGFGNDTLAGGNNNDTLYGNHGDDTLLGDSGNDYLNGAGLSGTEKDSLTGGSGSDTFVLSEKIPELGTVGYSFYANNGANDYALIKDWDPKSSSSDRTFDRLQLAGNHNNYKLESSSISGIGGSAKDTEIFFKLNNSWERVGIVQDSTNVSLSRDAVFI